MDEKAIRRKGYEDGHDAGYQDGMAKGIEEEKKKKCTKNEKTLL